MEKTTIGMKKKYVFYELPYYKYLNIPPTSFYAYVKKKSYSLWRHISLRKSDTLSMRRDHMHSNTKKQHWKKKATEK
jgi:hypothetical protein